VVFGGNNYTGLYGGRDDEGTLAAGLSLHLGGSGDFNNGWCYNPDGNSRTCITTLDERVFWTANVIPEPSTGLLLLTGLLGLAGYRRGRCLQG
jgi:PEP-CTERM motif